MLDLTLYLHTVPRHRPLLPILLLQVLIRLPVILSDLCFLFLRLCFLPLLILCLLSLRLLQILLRMCSLVVFLGIFLISLIIRCNYMNCPNPLYRFVASPASLCALGYIRPGCKDFLGKRPHRGAYFFNAKQLDLIPTELRSNLQPIGCGSCIACRLAYAQEWSLRLRLEASLYPCNLFLTLTYDDDHLPQSFFVDESTGEFHLSELQKRDISAFMKRLRSNLADRFNFAGVRFFASAEYGDKTDRPHYHLILLNCPPEIMRELVFLSKTKRGDVLYSSPYFDSLWKNGFVTVGACTPESIGYVARYALKKIGKFERTTFREVPFALMSRRPGIGAPYFYKHRESIEATGKVVVQDSEGSFVCNAPSYFYYLLYNLPIRAHRLVSTLHYNSSVLDAERKAIAHKRLLKDSRQTALDHVNDGFSSDLVGLPRPALSTSQGRLSSLKSKSEILDQKHKKYVSTFKKL